LIPAHQLPVHLWRGGSEISPRTLPSLRGERNFGEKGPHSAHLSVTSRWKNPKSLNPQSLWPSRCRHLSPPPRSLELARRNRNHLSSARRSRRRAAPL
jgi:hypothetical protein